jgi:hypothetical protein
VSVQDAESQLKRDLEKIAKEKALSELPDERAPQ